MISILPHTDSKAEYIEGRYREKRIFSSSTTTLILAGNFQTCEIIHYAPIILSTECKIRNVSFHTIRREITAETISHVSVGASFDFSPPILIHLCKKLADFETCSLYKEYANLFKQGFAWNNILGQANLGDAERRFLTKRLLLYLKKQGYEDKYFDEYLKQVGD